MPYVLSRRADSHRQYPAKALSSRGTDSGVAPRKTISVPVGQRFDEGMPLREFLLYVWRRPYR